MMKKKHFPMMLLLFILLTCFSSIRAANVQFMQLITKENTIIVALSEHPAITYAGNTLHIATKDNDIDVPVFVIDYFGFLETIPSAEDIKLPQTTKPYFSSDHIVFTQLKPNGIVETYSTLGHKVSVQSANNNGVAIVNLNNLPKGTYIIKTETQTIKITQK